MNNSKNDRLRSWILGTAATGLLLHSIPAVGDAGDIIIASNKKSVAKLATTQSSSKLQVLAIPSNVRAKNSSIRTVSQNVVTDGGKSEVQRQLEALYQQDGREMPEMNFNLQPINQGAAPGATPATVPPQQPMNPASAARPPQRTTQSNQKPARPVQGYTQYQPKPPATPYPNQSNGQPQPIYASTAEPQNPPQAKPRQTTVMGLFKKLTASNKQSAPLTTQAPIPPDFNTAVPSMASTGSTPNSNVGTFPQSQSQVRYPEPARLNTQAPRTLTQVPQPVSKSVTITTTQNQSPALVQSVAAVNSNVPQPAAPLPPLSEQPIPLAQQPVPLAQQPVPLANITAPSTMPSLQTDPHWQATVGTASIRREKAKTAPTAVNADFPNPFPLVAESEADAKIGSAPKGTALVSQQPTSLVESSGKVLISPTVEAPVTSDLEVATPSAPDSKDVAASEPNRINAADTSEDPYAVDAKDFVEPLIIANDNSDVDPTAPSLAEPTTLEAPTLDGDKSSIESLPSDELPTSDNEKMLRPTMRTEPPQEKMQKIHERFGMKGLKGFCPVALRDERELIDAKPEFFSIHRKQKFHFSSASARQKFEANPLRYKPAAYGADVVALSQNKDVVEGTLDFAAWYKGRLFLFGSQENYETFVKDPAQFATIEGME